MTTLTDNTLIDTQNDTSPAFTNDIDPIDLLTALDGFIHELDEQPEPATINRIEQQLAKYQILSVEHGHLHRWITAPVSIRKETHEYPLGYRIGHLLKSGGEWKKKTAYRDRIEVSTCAVLPLNIPVTGEEKNPVTVLAMKILALHSLLSEALETGEPIGVFEKPHGVTNLNRLKHWLGENENHGAWMMKFSLELHSLDAIVKKAVLNKAD